MADPKLELLRKKYAEEAQKSGPNRTFSGDNASYPFWNVPDQGTAVIRFLPDKRETNDWFWSERLTIKLPFSGTVGGESPTDKLVEVTVPCVDMFEDRTCPIIAETRPWWKDEAKKPLARLYYKKRSYITQGFVVSSPFEEPSVPENPIRRFMLGVKILGKLKAETVDVDREYLPYDYMNGYDFRIRKTKTGDGRNDYSTSSLSIKSRPLSEAEMIAIDTHGLYNLDDFRGPRPDADGIAAIKAMFHASLRGDPYDFESFGKFGWRPYGAGAASSSDDGSTSVSMAGAPTLDIAEEDDDDAPKVVAMSAPSVSSINSKEMLEKLKKNIAKRT